MKKPPSESDFERYSTGGGGDAGHNLMEKYAQENLNIHTRGLLRKKVPVIDMISWTKVREYVYLGTKMCIFFACIILMQLIFSLFLFFIIRNAKEYCLSFFHKLQILDDIASIASKWQQYPG